MENIRKYFEFLEQNKTKGLGILGEDPFGWECLEAIENKMLILNNDKLPIYINSLAKGASFQLDRLVDDYAYFNPSIAICTVLAIESSEYVKWLNGEYGESFQNKYQKLYESKNDDLIRYKYYESYEEYLKWKKDNNIPFIFEYESLSNKDENTDKITKSIYEYTGENDLLALDIHSNIEDEAFSSYYLGMYMFCDLLDDIAKPFGLNFNSLLYEYSDTCKKFTATLMSHATTKNNKEKAKINYLNKKYNSTITQAQLATMFRLFRDKGIIDKNMQNTSLANLINYLTGGSTQKIREYLGGTNASHINQTLTTQKQANEIQDILNEIITQIEEEKKYIVD